MRQSPQPNVPLGHRDALRSTSPMLVTGGSSHPRNVDAVTVNLLFRAICRVGPTMLCNRGR